MNISLVTLFFLINFTVPKSLKVDEDNNAFPLFGPLSDTAQDHILPNSDEVFFKKGKERNKRMHAQQLLDDLFKALNAFGSYISFSVDEFDSDLELLVFHVIETELVIKSLRPDNQELMLQNNFSQYVFENFMNARSLYDQFPPNLNQDYHVLYDLVQLNVGLFKLRKQDGTPDPLIKNYVGLVRLLARRTEQLITGFGLSGNISKDLDLVIQIQIKEIQMNLQELALYFPSREFNVRNGTFRKIAQK